jgi:hypothetical protein
MRISEPVEWLHKPCIGYAVNAGMSVEGQATLAPLLGELEETFGDKVYNMPLSRLHVTLLDWIAPLVDYNGENKDTLFNNLRTSYDAAMAQAIGERLPITVRFSEICVSPSTIYIRGYDDGTFDRIRHDFVSQVELLPGTKRPPSIIHSSLARFTGEVELNAVEEFLNEKTINFDEKVSEFRLIKSEREPMSDYKVLKSYR